MIQPAPCAACILGTDLLAEIQEWFEWQGWDCLCAGRLAEAERLLDELVSAQPVLVQISAAKQWRDRAEAAARRDGLSSVTRDQVARATGLTQEAMEQA